MQYFVFKLGIVCSATKYVELCVKYFFNQMSFTLAVYHSLQNNWSMVQKFNRNVIVFVSHVETPSGSTTVQMPDNRSPTMVSKHFKLPNCTCSSKLYQIIVSWTYMFSTLNSYSTQTAICCFIMPWTYMFRILFHRHCICILLCLVLVLIRNS